MEEPEGILNFDFERGLAVTAQASKDEEAQQAASTAAPVAPATAAAEATGPAIRRGARPTVCRHWLRGLCMKGDVCPYLHQLDHARMPVCRFYARYGECREPDCIFKHTFEDAKECHMYMFGFCPNGPDCRYKHVKLPGPLPSLEETYKKIQQRLAAAVTGTQSTRYMALKAQRQGVNSLHKEAKVVVTSQAQITAEIGKNPQNLEEDPLSLDLQATKETQKAVSFQATLSIPVGIPTTQLPPFISASIPLPQGLSRYFIVKSCNRENLNLSVSRGMWATHRNNEAKLNDAFDSSDNVILVFSVNETGHFQGCARMMSRIGVISGGGSWKYADGNIRYGRNFLLKWFKLCELSFHKTWHLRNAYNENLPVKISRDCQELEPTVGKQLASRLYEEPDSDLMKAANEAEAKRQEEAMNGVCCAMDLDGADNNQLDKHDDQVEELSEEDNSTSPIRTLTKEESRKMRTLSRLKFPFGRGSRDRRRDAMCNTYAMGYDSIAPNPAECFPLPGVGLGHGFPPFYPLQRYGMPIFPSIGPGSALGFGPIDSSPGMPFPVRRPPDGLCSPKKLNTLGLSGISSIAGRRPRNMPTVSKTRPGPSKLARLLTKVTQNGSRSIARTSAKNQQKRARIQTVVGVASKKRNTGKPLKSSLAGDVLGVKCLEAIQANHATFGRNSVSNEMAESLSEDEAPRRSRYGENKKRRQNEHMEHWIGTDRLED